MKVKVKVHPLMFHVMSPDRRHSKGRDAKGLFQCICAAVGSRIRECDRHIRLEVCPVHESRLSGSSARAATARAHGP